MKVRYPKFDFSDIRAHWTPHVEFAQRYNATSMIPTYIEPFLVKVMQNALPLLADAPETLRRDVEVFNKQEMQHCRQHLKFNNALHAQGYDAAKPIEAKFERDYERMLEKRSLMFNLAYCEGFESLSGTGLIFFTDAFAPYLEGADERALDLWKWHMAEEHEHRSLVNDVYHALYGHGWKAYAMRIFALLYAAVHILTFKSRVYAVLIGKDRVAMSKAEVKASKAREKEVARVAMAPMRKLLPKIFAKSYDPSQRPDPVGLVEYLRKFEKPSPAAAAA